MWCRGPPVDLGQSSCEALCAERSSRKREAKAIYIGMPCRRRLWYFLVQKSGEWFAPLNKQNIYATSTQMSEGLQTSPSRKLMFHHIIKSYPNEKRSLFTPRGNHQNNPLLLAIPCDARPQYKPWHALAIGNDAILGGGTWWNIGLEPSFGDVKSNVHRVLKQQDMDIAGVSSLIQITYKYP